MYPLGDADLQIICFTKLFVLEFFNCFRLTLVYKPSLFASCVQDYKLLMPFRKTNFKFACRLTYVYALDSTFDSFPS